METPWSQYRYYTLFFSDLQGAGIASGRDRWDGGQGPEGESFFGISGKGGRGSVTGRRKPGLQRHSEHMKQQLQRVAAVALAVLLLVCLTALPRRARGAVLGAAAGRAEEQGNPEREAVPAAGPGLRPSGSQSRQKTETLTVPTLRFQSVKAGIEITWEPLPRQGVRYILYRKEMTGSFRPIAEQRTCRCLDTDVSSGRTYTYRLETADGAGRTGTGKSVCVSYRKPPEEEAQDRERYVVSCNINFDNEVNTLGRYPTREKAAAAIQAQSADTRGQWFIYDSQNQMELIYPQLQTRSQRLEAAVRWMLAVEADPRHGYSCEGEETDNNYQIDHNRWGKRGDYSCSTLVVMACELTGVADLRSVAAGSRLSCRAHGREYRCGISSDNLAALCLRSGRFADVTETVRKKGTGGLRRGDILIRADGRHTAAYLGNGLIVHAVTNEMGVEYASPQPGDQDGGREIRISGLGGVDTWGRILRAK